MDETAFWLTPLILLPGVALVLMSTSIRYGQLHEEFHHLRNESPQKAQRQAGPLFRRATLFRNALVCLYGSVTLLALSSLVGGIASLWLPGSKSLTLGIALVGFLGVVMAAVELVRESQLSLDVIREHCSEIRSPVDPP